MPETSLPTLLADRALLHVGGSDARAFLQGLVTNDVAAVAPGAPRWAALLSAQGKVLFDFVLWNAEDGILIDCEGAEADALARRLAMYRLRRPVTIERVAGGVHWRAVAGEGAVADPRLPALGARWIGAADGAPADDAWRAHRLGLGVCEGVAELGSGELLWLECNARELNGVSFTKGCYVGQENTARMHHRAKVNRRLVVVPDDPAGERIRLRYPELGLAIAHRRVEALGDAIIPDWLAAALAEPVEA